MTEREKGMLFGLVKDFTQRSADSKAVSASFRSEGNDAKAEEWLARETVWAGAAGNLEMVLKYLVEYPE